MKAAEYLQKRLDAGLSQSEIHRRTGFSRTHVIKVETGQSGASPEYEAAFLAAISGVDISSNGGDGGANVIVQSSKRVKLKLGRTLNKLNFVLGNLERHRQVLDMGIRSVRDVEEYVEMIASDVPTLDLERFDPTLAIQADIDKVSEHICSVLAELLIDHNFHKLDPDIMEDYLQRWVKVVSREVRKHRNRAANV